MTVAALIEELEDYGANLPVVVYDDRLSIRPVFAAHPGSYDNSDAVVLDFE